MKVYAVGSYLDPTQFIGKQDDAEIEKALLDPKFHRTIRIVMNRSMTMDKYNDAIVEALTPRMNGQDLDKYVFCFQSLSLCRNLLCFL